ncbi:hypothetical protein FisN_6Lh195 [Fistulifera solaris]|uniref:Uncharacterized protein n=1 Tax=Fistulifera solaris TaxID=1519565 RepID=A0A1Z5J670_FISSO|nr:hypothetical protein FisN_6Lh195 [Fistulifera solaris]|eukprot:GAX09429.1 hypothetical protein FisN_6Lh195 [Fistulifera solaris]
MSRSTMQRILLVVLFLQQLVEGFVVIPSTTTSRIAITKTASLPSTLTTAVSTVDPTTFLSDVLGGVLGTPIILAVPILAALGVASLVAYAIIAYASPAADDDE